MNSERNQNSINSRITSSHLSILSVFSIFWYCALPFTNHWMTMDLRHWRQFSSSFGSSPIYFVILATSWITALFVLISIFGWSIPNKKKWLHIAFIFCIIPNLIYTYFGFMDFLYISNTTDYPYSVESTVISLIPIVLLVSLSLFISYLCIKKGYKKHSTTKKHGIETYVTEDDEQLHIKIKYV